MVLLNVRGYFNALREFVACAIREGFILPKNEHLWIIVDDPRTPESHEAGEDWDWGAAALAAIERWERIPQSITYDWNARMPGQSEGGGAYEAM